MKAQRRQRHIRNPCPIEATQFPERIKSAHISGKNTTQPGKFRAGEIGRRNTRPLENPLLHFTPSFPSCSRVSHFSSSIAVVAMDIRGLQSVPPSLHLSLSPLFFPFPLLISRIRFLKAAKQGRDQRGVRERKSNT